MASNGIVPTVPEHAEIFAAIRAHSVDGVAERSGLSRTTVAVAGCRGAVSRASLRVLLDTVRSMAADGRTSLNPSAAA